MVDLLPYNPKVEALSSALTAGTGREEMVRQTI